MTKLAAHHILSARDLTRGGMKPARVIVALTKGGLSAADAAAAVREAQHVSRVALTRGSTFEVTLATEHVPGRRVLARPGARTPVKHVSPRAVAAARKVIAAKKR